MLSNKLFNNQIKKSDNMSNELLDNLSITYNHSYNTKRAYKTALKQYCAFFDMDLIELLKEAEEEENNGIKWKHCKLKNRLLQFRQHLLNNFSLNTVKVRMNHVIKFYKFYDIEIYELPKISNKSTNKATPIYFKDLPDKEIIREALNIADPRMKAAILFICSSGCGRAETLSLTIQDYIDALSEYIPNKNKSILEIIDIISENDNIIPTFNILRKKTNKYYTTYCSPEAVKAINTYLLSRTDNLTNKSQLFKVSGVYFIASFQIINDKLGLGRVGEYSRFRSHMLRKFHASALYNDGMSLDNVNDLQGKAKNKTDQAYFMINPEDLKYEYIKHLPAVTIMEDVKKLSIKSPEFMQMENENNELKSELTAIKSEISDLTGIRAEIAEMKSLKEELLHIKNDS